MLVANYIIIVIIVIALGILYQKFCEKQYSIAGLPEGLDNYNEIKKYLLSDSYNESALAKSKKPILWIYVPHEYNTRNWSSFGSRSSYDLNQPYLYLTVKSIIKCCDKSFHICIIDDQSFDKLLPESNYSATLATVGEPILANVRQLAIAKLIHLYGGVSVPISFLCNRDLVGLYEKGTRDDTMFVCENINTNISATNEMFYPDVRFMGAKKNNEMMEKYIEHLEKLMGTNYAAEHDFLGGCNAWIKPHIDKKHGIRLIPGTDVGTKTVNEDPVLIDNLLNQDFIQFYNKMYGIWIPADQILKRNNYEWFARLSADQIFQSNTILGKQFVSIIGAITSEMTINGPVTNGSHGSNDWVSFWRVPATNGTLNVYGMMPSGLGDNVPRSNSTGSID
jgi:hypothetical protein